MNKYNNSKIELGNTVFDSIKEASRYVELFEMSRAGDITDLKLQPKFVLIPKFRDNDGVMRREASYFADFSYFNVSTQEMFVEDSKGFKTDVFRLKEKLFRYRYPDIKFILT